MDVPVLVSETETTHALGAPAPSSADPLWWRSAVIYQLYIRSFADGDGDGTGDLSGVRAHLGYLKELGVDALWFTPWYASPLADGGYDVSDYRKIHPAFGELEEAEALIREALALGIRTIIDVVPNHISNEHEWFKAALAAGRGSPERERFWFVDSDEMPTQWVSNFQGDTWTQVADGQWYLHLFTPEQPDLNWNHPDVRREHEEVLRFWFDRGVAGVRIDSAALLVKDPALPEVTGDEAPGQHPNTDRDEVHDIYRSWRAVADEYPGTRVLVGEVWMPDPVRFTNYLRPDEMHTAFNFDFMARPWRGSELRESIDSMLAAHAPVGAPSTWVLSNHDVTRTVTRYGREDSSFAFASKRFGTPTDLELGTRRARAAALLSAALPGSLYIYQGDELGLPEVEDLPAGSRQDPMHFRSNGVDPGRDGCRVPLPWAGTRPPFGFSAGEAQPWLPQPEGWAPYTVESEAADPASMLSLYRSALAIRRSLEGDESFSWLDSDPDVLCFTRGGGFVSVTNLSDRPIDLPEHEELLLGSAELVDGQLAPDSTAWLRPTSHA